ncbi:HNH endonuclease family protein [Endozoicomonas euniceicola]|uniref:TIGR02646 family protein n=1 Tax=Endozoicomonas euniceicola TaxID=1234143 RepID=A0ABY6GW36_9GAMM|nr:hypothetical protein [Endozoicomonas euniceicola]UYM16973.1 hypothetical protein NX720_03345 [Endozoicomonas euniceicola]
MRRISKIEGFEPESLRQWKARNPRGNYGDLTEKERQDIRTACLEEQFYLCAYCCQSISGENSDCMNEHVEARRIAPGRSLDFSNIVVSCTTPKQCDNAHRSKPLPLMPECETEFEFKLSGRVIGKTLRAIEAIGVLNLGDREQNNRSLIEKRKQLVQTLLFTNGVNPEEGLDDDELIEIVIGDISKPKNGKLEAFAPVAVNVLRQWMQ